MTNIRETSQNKEPMSASFLTAGERWSQAAILFTQRRIPQLRWIPFTTSVQSRHADAVNKVEARENRVRAETSQLPRTLQSSLPDEAEALITAAEAPVVGTMQSSRTQQSSLPDKTKALVAAAEAPVSDLPLTFDRSSHFFLDARIKQFLGGLLNIRIPAVTVYTSQAADQMTRRYGADAITYRDNIFFRSGQYKPHETAGMALLGHELTHVAQSRMESSSGHSQMATPTLERQEQQALENEARVLQHFASPIPLSIGSHLPGNLWRGMEQPHQPSHQQPAYYDVSKSSPTISQSRGSDSEHRAISPVQSDQMRTALSSREVSLPTETNTMSYGSPYLSIQQLNQIKEEVYQDLMNRIRIDFERGG